MISNLKMISHHKKATHFGGFVCPLSFVLCLKDYPSVLHKQTRGLQLTSPVGYCAGSQSQTNTVSHHKKDLKIDTTFDQPLTFLKFYLAGLCGVNNSASFHLALFLVQPPLPYPFLPFPSPQPPTSTTTLPSPPIFSPLG